PAGEVGGSESCLWLNGGIVQEPIGLWLRLPEQPIVGMAQGCQPVGSPLLITSAHGNVIDTLDGKPAFTAFSERAGPLLGDLRRASQAVFLAVPTAAAAAAAGDRGDDETAWDNGEYYIRGVLALEPSKGAIAASEPLAEGTRIRFAIRSSYWARQSLRTLVERVRCQLRGKTPRLGLYFCCSGRGHALFGVDNHDIAFIQHGLGHFPLAGVFAGGELGPLAGRTRLNLFSGVLAVVP
ncbi:MAG: FIST C-terminal domain-containing protein, partial [Pseudomonadota bacterium]